MSTPILKSIVPERQDLGRIRQNIYLYEPQWDFLRQYAHDHYASMSEVLRALIDKLATENLDLTLDMTNRSVNRHKPYNPPAPIFDSNSVLNS